MPEVSLYVPGEEYTSARATPQLVGREKELKQIEWAIKDVDQSYIVYISGQGGIGKTRLVRCALEDPPSGTPLAVASELIDLYHTRVHSLAGLIGAILDVVEPLNEHFREELERAGADKLEEVTRAEQEGFTLAEIISRRRELTDFFIEVFNRFSSQRRVVLALDTAERTQVSDPTQELLGLSQERLYILDWLLEEFLPSVNNVVILLAGRPGPGKLRDSLEQIEGKQFLPIELRGLTEEETLDYFEAMAAAASNDPPTAEAIVKLEEENRRTIFHCLCEEQDQSRTVRPILLALAIDYLVVEGRPLPELSRPLDEAKQLQPQERRAIQDQLGRELVRTIRDNRRPADEVILALAWLRKGADADLLARVTDLDQSEVEEALSGVRDLSFVKIRPADDRVFLHDEMYDLLEDYALDQVAPPRRDAVFNAIMDYYDQKIAGARQEVTDLYAPLAETALPQPEEVITARVHLQDALVEDLHYRLRYRQVEGFQTYYRYAEEAVSAGDESLDMQLHAELLSLLTEYDPTGSAPDIHGLRRADVLADAAVRWTKRLVGRGKYQQARDVAQRLREDFKQVLIDGGVLAEAELDTWEGLALAYKGELDEAESLLDRAITHLQSVPNALHTERWSGILARAYNNLGYSARVQGQIIRAAQAYRQALPHWRRLGMEIEQANTLNNLAYVLGLQGKLSEARRLGQDALGLREQLGPRGPVVLSLTTLAEIEIFAGRYREAQAYAERALALSQGTGFRRGEGLARLALAALYRFRAEPEQMLSAQERQDLLEESLGHSREALRIFAEEVVEPERATKAWYEQALTLREQCRLLGPHDPERADLAEKASELFDKIAEGARESGRWDTYLDARLGELWTHYYLGSPDLHGRLDRIEEEARVQLPDYLIAPTRWPDVAPTTVLGVFSQLARYHVLKGILALDREYRWEAGQQFALAFEYDRIIAEDFRDLNRGINVVHNRLRKLNVRELLQVFEAAGSILGALMPEDVPGRIERREDLLVWRVLEDHFGSYDILQQLAGQD